MSSMDAGRTLKVHMSSLPAGCFESEVMPAFKQMGDVRRFNDEETKAQLKIDKEFGSRQKRKSESVGDLQSTSDLLRSFNDIHGKGGSQKKARRYARRGLKVLTTAQTVASHGLREAAVVESASESGDDA